MLSIKSVLDSPLRRGILLLIALALVVAACGGGSASTTAVDDQTDATEAAEGDHSDDEGDHEEEFQFGEPADAGEASRTIEVAANDTLTFDPAEITVSAGEIVTFKVTNTGNLPHDFTLGDQETQDAHEAEMMEMMEDGEMTTHDEPNAISLAVGETKEITWHFSEAGTVLFGCHVPGHYDAGMKGEVSVDA